MRSSRTPEGRGGTNRRVVLFSMIAMVAIAGLAVTYFTQGFGSLSAKTDQTEHSQVDAAASSTPLGQSALLGAAPTSVPAPAPTAAAAPRPTSTPVPTATHTPPKPTPTPLPPATPAAASTTGAAGESALEPDTFSVLKLLPEVEFGEALGEGVMKLKLPAGNLVDIWYTFQVDTKTRDITVFYALFDEKLQSVMTTVRIDNYTQGNELENAEVTLYYPDGSERVLAFDRTEGTMVLTQLYKLPHGPSMFSSGLRRALVYYGIKLQDETGDTTIELHLDVSGLSESEEIVFKQSAPAAVETVLEEIKVLVDQIEEKRLE